MTTRELSFLDSNAPVRDSSLFALRSLEMVVQPGAWLQSGSLGMGARYSDFNAHSVVNES